MSDVTVKWVDAQGAVRSGGLEELGSASTGLWQWVDIKDPDETVVEVVGKAFGLHPLAIEDALHIQRRPKLDTYSSGLFLVWLVPERVEEGRLATSEFDAFLGPGYLVTLRAENVSAVSAVAQTGEREMQRGPDWILHAIIDRLVDSTLPLADGLGDELEAIEDNMLGEPRRDDLARLHSARRQLVFLHRIIALERDIIRELSRERDVVSEDAYRYFRDVGDHLARVEETVDTYRDVAAAVMDIYLSAQSNRMNEIMKQLTVVATIFMPLTLISGIYGMNVLPGMWPPADAFWSFAGIIAGMLGIATVMALYFRRRNWW
ncbi:MAG: magnesium/cobalt transporter CorA [Coriobacteriia bacterium]